MSYNGYYPSFPSWRREFDSHHPLNSPKKLECFRMDGLSHALWRKGLFGYWGFFFCSSGTAFKWNKSSLSWTGDGSVNSSSWFIQFWWNNSQSSWLVSLYCYSSFRTETNSQTEIQIPKDILWKIYLAPLQLMFYLLTSWSGWYSELPPESPKWQNLLLLLLADPTWVSPHSLTVYWA